MTAGNGKLSLPGGGLIPGASERFKRRVWRSGRLPGRCRALCRSGVA